MKNIRNLTAIVTVFVLVLSFLTIASADSAFRTLDERAFGPEPFI